MLRMLYFFFWSHVHHAHAHQGLNKSSQFDFSFFSSLWNINAICMQIGTERNDLCFSILRSMLKNATHEELCYRNALPVAKYQALVPAAFLPVSLEMSVGLFHQSCNKDLQSRSQKVSLNLCGFHYLKHLALPESFREVFSIKHLATHPTTSRSIN